MRCSLCDTLAVGIMPPGWVLVELRSTAGAKYMSCCPGESADRIDRVFRQKLAELYAQTDVSTPKTKPNPSTRKKR